MADIDAILVTPLMEYYQISSYLKCYSAITTISVRDILSEALSEQEFVDFSEYLQQRNVKVFLFNKPDIEMIDNPSLWEQAMMYAPSRRRYTIKRKHFYQHLYEGTGIHDVESYIRDLVASSIVLSDDQETECVYKDVTSPLKNVIGGYRYVPAQPDEYENTVYTFGDCSNQLGDDTRTFGNILQIILNASATRKFRVLPYNNTIRSISFLLRKIMTLSLKSGDIIVYVNVAFRNNDHNHRFFKNLPNIYCYDLMSDFSRPHNYGEIFHDYLHTTVNGSKLLADAVFKYITESGALDNPASACVAADTTASNSEESPQVIDLMPELEMYKKYLDENRVCSTEGTIGAIVVNCNPFTNGHKYIIEYAAGQVDFLYVFVVEEDKSVFSFNDRIELVKKGVEHLDNVKVLRSGMFIISTVTFESYFKKEDMPEAEIDATEDVRVFATHVAPILNVSVRFAGSEPLCAVTRQYNRAMAEILPSHGITFKEIERVRYGDNYISASYVRELLEANNFDEIRKIVPTSTYEYLKLRKNKSSGG